MKSKKIKHLNKNTNYQVGDILKWHKNLLQVKKNNRVCNINCFFRGKGVGCLFYCKNIEMSGYVYFNHISEIEYLILKNKR